MMHQHKICRIFPCVFIFTKHTTKMAVIYVHASKRDAPCKITGCITAGASQTYRAHCESIFFVCFKNNDEFNLISNSNLLKT